MNLMYEYIKSYLIIKVLQNKIPTFIINFTTVKSKNILIRILNFLDFG